MPFLKDQLSLNSDHKYFELKGGNLQKKKKHWAIKVFL